MTDPTQPSAHASIRQARRRTAHVNGGPADRDAARERAVVDAEARLLARILETYGVLSVEALEELSRARRWRDGGFHEALTAAVRGGLIEPLPCAFCRSAATRSDRPEAAAVATLVRQTARGAQRPVALAFGAGALRSRARGAARRWRR
jgi:hypothetical protein